VQTFLVLCSRLLDAVEVVLVAHDAATLTAICGDAAILLLRKGCCPGRGASNHPRVQLVREIMGICGYGECTMTRKEDSCKDDAPETMN
jgi:hypothetical protein